MPKKKLSYEFVKEQFSLKGCLLLETEYINNSTKMKYRCLKHPELNNLSIDYDHFTRRKTTCPICRYESSKSKQRLNYQFVKTIFESFGYELLETEYINTDTKMRYRCPYHPNKEMSIKFDHLKNGHGCNYCGNERISGENSYRWNGGITTITSFLRSKLSDWKNDVLRKYNYTCFITGERGVMLHIHHATKPFSLILTEILNETKMPILDQVSKYSEEQVEVLTYKIQDAHKYVEGIPIREDIHRLFHSEYGRDEHVCFDDLLEFKKRYLNNEFLVLS